MYIKHALARSAWFFQLFLMVPVYIGLLYDCSGDLVGTILLVIMRELGVKNHVRIFVYSGCQSIMVLYDL